METKDGVQDISVLWFRIYVFQIDLPTVQPKYKKR